MLCLYYDAVIYAQLLIKRGGVFCLYIARLSVSSRMAMTSSAVTAISGKYVPFISWQISMSMWMILLSSSVLLSVEG